MQDKRFITDLSEQGFSLLETLIALAIMSIASLALFQSTATMLSVSDRAVKTSERVLDGALNRRAMTGLLSGLVPAWPEDGARSFKGTASRLEGLSAESLSWQNEALGSGLSHFSLTLSGEAQNNTQPLNAWSLRYEDLTSNGNSRTRDEGWVLDAGLPANTRFRYLGLDGTWRANWPPPTPPATPYFNDALFITTSPLPEAVKLETGQGVVLAIVAVRRHAHSPLRLDLGRDSVQ